MTADHFDVLIMGAGLSGIGTACQMAAEVPNRSVALIERRQRLGGTWDLFRYPGIRSDADMLTMGYGFRPWRDPKVLADGSSIREYIAETAAEYGVDEKIHYGLKIVAAEWSSASSRWTVTALREATGETCRYTCGYLVNCTGYYDHDAGYVPEFPGVERFTGRFVHPQHWPEDLDYTGKKVVVIGSGATAVTLVPAMAGDAEHVTMLQRSPSYILSFPSFDKISEGLSRVLPRDRVYAFARKRNIVMLRQVYLACRRWPKLVRRILVWQARRKVGPTFDMRHLTPKYMPWDQRLCVASDGDLFKALVSGEASMVTDEIETFTETGVLLRSGRELEADLIVTATGLNLQMLGGVRLSVDGEACTLNDRITYKGVLVEGIPNLAWFFGYTNAPWTLKSDISGAYLCRLFKHMDANGYLVATPRDGENCATAEGLLDHFQTGYVQRAKDIMPRQGSRTPWKVRMDYGKDCRILLDDPVDDGVLSFDKATAEAVV
jgi:cation diffusion facilitator CzcD-associated flavoprotein CzcO